MFLIGAAVQSSGLPPSFYGSLIGSFISGSVAVGILIYNNWKKNKEFNFRCYGTMKVINDHLVYLSQWEQLTLKVLREMIDKEGYRNEGLLKILKNSKGFFEEQHTLLEKERANIPYDFTTRYFTIVSAIHSVTVAYDQLIEEPGDPDRYETLVNQMSYCNKIIKVFNKNTTQYLKNVEKKYKIKDFY
ncbi:hypothetical protein [Peribacillus sp. ACCC06369]|uniref:hypothetical protein n=1 Tax=Peribacillus sp. ACCC06369 TaxID=3055860 RepID=UPI0025A002D8|nr:hypothetical protein [Peribacillus sp. ACCC06369]MDM5357058.1 hypothetical protein [Peribacillus sp. ACCC06369]